MSGQRSKTKKTLKILRGCEQSRLQRAVLVAAYELVTPILRGTLTTGSAAQPRSQTTAILATGTGGNPS